MVVGVVRASTYTLWVFFHGQQKHGNFSPPMKRKLYFQILIEFNPGNIIPLKTVP